MKKGLKVTLISLGALLGLILVLLLTAAILVQNRSFQNRVLQTAVSSLSEQLNTRVAIDSIDISFVTQRIHLYGLAVDDQQGRPLLEMERLAVQLDMWALLDRSIHITAAEIVGLSAHMLKPSKEEPSNFQFIIDAFKKPKDDAAADVAKKDTATARPLQFDLKKLELWRVQFTYNDQAASFDHFEYAHSWNNCQTAILSDVYYRWTSHPKRGPVDNTLHVAKLHFSDEQQQTLLISGLHYTSDNHQPRKNTNRPKRGFFDVGHIDATADLRLTLLHLGKDTLALTLDECQARDSVTGFNVRELSLRLEANRQGLCIHDLLLQQQQTIVRSDSAYVQLRDTVAGRDFEYHIPEIHVQAVLRDIARPFAPVLSQFTIPLQVSTSMDGNRTEMHFGNVRVRNADARLTINAVGSINNLQDSHQLAVRFNVHKMQAKGNVKHQILDQFPVKKLMMEAFDALGSISYTGQFTVLWRREQFSGVLTTEAGALNFDFTLDDNNKYVSGHARTENFQIAKVVDAPKVGPVSFSAQFKVDISKERTAQMRRQKGGKLPIGTVRGVVGQASYKGIKVTNIDIDIESDGAIAAGSAKQRGRLIDLSCAFTMTSTTDIKEVKVRPRLQLHSATDEERQERAERKAQKREERETRRAQKREERAARKEQRCQEREAGRSGE